MVVRLMPLPRPSRKIAAASGFHPSNLQTILCPGGYLSERRASDVLLEGANVFRRIGAGQITDVLGIVGGCDGQVLS